jgi:hypothetical protein
MPDYTVKADVDSMLRADNDAGIRSAIGLGQTDVPTFAGLNSTGIIGNGVFGILPNSSGISYYDSQSTFRIRNAAGGYTQMFTLLPSGELTLGPTAANVTLVPDAAGILAQRNGTAAQAFRVYNTYTDASNYERLNIQWSGNAMRIFPSAAGSGTPRIVYLGSDAIASTAFLVDSASNLLQMNTGGLNRWQVNSSGHFLANTDNLYDIGASGANRPRNIYVGTSIFCESDINGARDVYCGNNRYYRFNVNGTTGLSSSGAGILTMADLGATNTTPRITLGGTTSAFPAIKRNGTGIDIVLADDSGFGPAQSLYQRFGSGTPEGVVTAPIGATYNRTNGGAGTSLYVKESSPTPSTGWVAK